MKKLVVLLLMLTVSAGAQEAGFVDPETFFSPEYQESLRAQAPEMTVEAIKSDAWGWRNIKHSIYLSFGMEMIGKDSGEKLAATDPFSGETASFELSSGLRMGLTYQAEFLPYLGAELFFSYASSSASLSDLFSVGEVGFTTLTVGLNAVGKYKFVSTGIEAYSFIGLAVHNNTLKLLNKYKGSCLGWQLGLGANYGLGRLGGIFNSITAGLRYEYTHKVQDTEHWSGQRMDVDYSGHAISVMLGYRF